MLDAIRFDHVTTDKLMMLNSGYQDWNKHPVIEEACNRLPERNDPSIP